MKDDKKLKKKVLITYGPTWVAIDDMRVISNRSSGSMGKLIAEDLIRFGTKVTVLEGPVIEPLKNEKVTIKKFTFFDEFAKIFKAELKKKYDIVIHAAAVSDFQPAQKSRKKISSDKPRTLTLIPTEKLIKTVKRLSPKSILVGFKLESTSDQRRLKYKALESIKTNQCDLIIANSFKKGYSGFIFNKDGNILGQGTSRRTISKQLTKHLLKLYT